MGKMKLTALKMSGSAFASADSRKRVPWEGRGDVNRVGVGRVGVGRVGFSWAGIARVGIARVGIARVGIARVSIGGFNIVTRRKVSVGGGRNVGMGRGEDSARGRRKAFGRRRKGFSRWREGFARWRRNRTCSHKGDKGESRNDFELHIVFFVVVVLNTSTEDCLSEESR